MDDPGNTQTTQPEGFVDTDGSLIDGWQSRLSDESLREEPSLARFKSFNDLAKSFVSTKQMMGRDPDTLVEIPGENATDEVRAEFHRKRGVPDTVEGYKYERSKELSDKVDTSPEKIELWSQIAKRHNLTPTQFNGVANDWLQGIDKDIASFDLAQEERDEQERKKGVAVLKKHLGNALEERTLRAEGLMRKYGDRLVKDAKGNELNILEQLYKELPSIENSPWIRLLLDNVAEDMSEDRIKGLTTTTVDTPSQIATKLAELKAHPAYMDDSNPQHRDIMNQVTELYKKKAG